MKSSPLAPGQNIENPEKAEEVWEKVKPLKNAT